jgi:hypothetical protein
MAKKVVNSSDLFNEVLKTVEVMGMDETSKILQKARFNSLTLHDGNIEFILKTVSKQTSVEVERIIHGTDKTDERKIAVALCVYYIKAELKYSYGIIKKILKKDEAALSRYFSLVKRVDMKSPRGTLNQSLCSHINQLNVLFTEKKLNSYVTGK